MWERLDGGPAAPPALQEHSATPHEASLYVFGGEVGALATETPLWVYNTEVRHWMKDGNVGIGRQEPMGNMYTYRNFWV